METENSAAVGELAALDETLSALFNSPRDGLPLLERFGSYAGIYSATEKELCAVSGMTERAAQFFVYVKKLLRCALFKELEFFPPNSERAALIYTAAYFFGEQQSAERMLCLDKNGCVQKILELDGADALRHVVGKAALEMPHSIIWIKYEPSGPKTRIDPKRKTEAERGKAACKKLRVPMLDYIEYRPPYFYSAQAAARCGEWRTDVNSASQTLYSGISPKAKETDNESSAVRYGRNARPDGRRKIHEGVL